MDSIFLKNLTKRFQIRSYQREALDRLKVFFEDRPSGRHEPLHLLFHMATGSGKTFLMATNILYLYEQGYRNFLFFVNSTAILQKTKDNFLDKMSPKYLFNERLFFEGREIFVEEVQNFQSVCDSSVNIVFTTVQALHLCLSAAQENVMTLEDFNDQKVVFLSDEAHHINALTKKKSSMTQKAIRENMSWENTVSQCFLSHRENILLEYTATIDFDNRDVFKKYRKKIAYRYTLKDLRRDKYSKEICLLQSDFSFKDRILQALLLSQYRLNVAEKHGIRLKPVVMMKVQKTIAQLQEAQEHFRSIITDLKTEDMDRIDQNIGKGVLRRAFDFFKSQGLSYENLIEEIRVNFAEERCLAIHSHSCDKDKIIALNTLEDENNGIRVIFTVNMLNEGWDVLNLFDIVRLYETLRWDQKRPRHWKRITLSEAQLIGRGARYNPFVLSANDDPFRRKYDNDIHNELKILEELHYHSVRDLRYISELRSELIRVGLSPSESEKKRAVKQKQREIDKNSVNNFSPKRLFEDPFHYRWDRSRTRMLNLLDNKNSQERPLIRRTILFTDMNRHIKRKALDTIVFYRFSHLKTLFPSLISVEEFLLSKKYLASVRAEFWGEEAILKTLSCREQYTVAYAVLKALAKRIELQKKKNFWEKNGGSDGTRTRNRLIDSQEL